MAIILVVFGHATKTYTADWSVVSSLWYWAAIHHFHMALFMFVSGYVAYGKLGSKWLQRRFLQIALPYVGWSIVLYYWSALSFSGLQGVYPTEGGANQECPLFSLCLRRIRSVVSASPSCAVCSDLPDKREVAMDTGDNGSGLRG
jgi:fucose 4-O-acetylase-like acetyltransferase